MVSDRQIWYQGSNSSAYLKYHIEIHGSQCCLGLSPHSETKQKFKGVDERKVVREPSQLVYKVWSSSFERVRKNKAFVDLAFYMGFSNSIYE